MGIIEFLMNNLFILIVIAGFIINFLQRFKDFSKQDNTKDIPIPMPSKPVQVENRSKETKNVMVVSKKADSNSAVRLAREKAAVREPIQKKKKTAQHVGISKKAAVQGFIWSEILAPPKAKRK